MNHLTSFYTTIHPVATYLSTGWRRKALNGFFFFLTIVIIVKIVVDNQTLFVQYYEQTRPEWLFYAVIFFLIDFLLALYAWHLLVKRLANYDNFRKTVKFCLQANLARRIPGAIWYIASRAVLYQEVGINKITTSLLSGLELLLFISSGLTTALLTLPFWFSPIQVKGNITQVLLIASVFVLSLLLVHPKILQTVWQKFSPHPFTQELYWQDTIIWFLVYIATWIVGAVVLFCVINLFEPLPITYLGSLIGIWSLAGSISLAGAVTISFFSLREVSLILLLTQILPLPLTIITAVVIRLIWLFGELITALFALRL